MPSALKRIYWELSAGRGMPEEYLPDYLFLVQQHWFTFRKLRFFVRPRSYSELLYRKMLRDRDPRMRAATEKVTARDYVAAKVGPDVLIPLLHVGDDPARIPFADLPAGFVIKATHGSGFVIIVADKSRIDEAAVRGQVARWLEMDWYRLRREWAYKDVPRRVIVEELLLDRGMLPANIRFHVFNGRVRLIHINERVALPSGMELRNVNLTNNWFDGNFEPLVVQLDETKPAAPVLPEKPQNFDEMKRIALRLAEDFEYCRVDLYSVDGRPYFGEITQYPSGGMRRFTPPDFDAALGEAWRTGADLPRRFYARARAAQGG